ncbi:hypothetical protein L218DRAFT_361959 [Marasmius fiardii PR-910]|nr:hypothetical protein L218DRAFT_361959 [Marasmius fiardii PR-910]
MERRGSSTSTPYWGVLLPVGWTLTSRNCPAANTTKSIGASGSVLSAPVKGLPVENFEDPLPSCAPLQRNDLQLPPRQHLIRLSIQSSPTHVPTLAHTLSFSLTNHSELALTPQMVHSSPSLARLFNFGWANLTLQYFPRPYDLNLLLPTIKMIGFQMRMENDGLVRRYLHLRCIKNGT